MVRKKWKISLLWLVLFFIVVIVLGITLYTSKSTKSISKNNIINSIVNNDKDCSAIQDESSCESSINCIPEYFIPECIDCKPIFQECVEKPEYTCKKSGGSFNNDYCDCPQDLSWTYINSVMGCYDCESMEKGYPGYYDQCIYDLAWQKNNTTICDKLENRDLCYQTFAYKRNRKDICKLISNESRRLSCLESDLE